MTTTTADVARCISFGVAAVVLALLAAGCSSTTNDEPLARVGDEAPAATSAQELPVEPEPTSTTTSIPARSPGAAWVAESFSRRAPQSNAYVIADADGIVTIATARDGQVRVRRADGLGNEVVIEDAIPPIAIAFFNDSLVLVALDASGRSQVWLSEDGSQWDNVAEVLPASPGQRLSMNVLTTVGGQLVAAGQLDNSSAPVDEGSAEGPAIWTSPDALTWSRGQIEFDAPFGGIFDITEIDDTLIATGSAGEHGAMWRSVDNGETWTQHEISVVGTVGGDRAILGLAVLGDVLVGVGTSTAEPSLGQIGWAGDPMIVRSLDAGVTWEPAQLDPAIAIGLREGLHVLIAAGDALWAATGRSLDSAVGEWDNCYLDLAGCRAQRQHVPVLLRSTDGAEWTEVGLSDLDPPIGLQISELVDIGSGVAIVDALDQLVVYSWQSTDAPPEAEPLDLEILNIALVEQGANLDLGVTYRYPLSSYCGIEILGDFNGTFWALSSGEQRPDEANWPWVSDDQVIYGFMTLIEEATIRYHPTQDPNLRPNIYKPANDVTQMCT